MRISVIAVGTRMPAWVTQAIAEYTRRLPRELNVVWTEIPLAKRGKDAAAQQWRASEGEQILKAIAPGERVIALAVDGKRLCTEQLAQNLSAWRLSGDNYSLVIGGPDGLSPACLARAEQCWSLSDLTLPHPLVRVVLAEQLYRAWTITVNHPYHRA